METASLCSCCRLSGRTSLAADLSPGLPPETAAGYNDWRLFLFLLAGFLGQREALGLLAAGCAFLHVVSTLAVSHKTAPSPFRSRFQAVSVWIAAITCPAVTSLENPRSL